MNVWNVNFLKLIFGASLIIILSKLTQFLDPKDLYFSFSAFFFNYPRPISPVALIIKICIPIVTGIIVGFISRENVSGTTGFSGFLGSFILAWPVIVSWDLHAPYELYDKQNAFYIILTLYIISFSYICIAGGRLSTVFLRWIANRDKSGFIRDLTSWNNSIKPVLIGTISGIFATIIAKLITK